MSFSVIKLFKQDRGTGARVPFEEVCHKKAKGHLHDKRPRLLGLDGRVYRA